MLTIRQQVTTDIEHVVRVWERSRWDAQPWLEERMGHSHDDNMRFFTNVVSEQNAVWLALDGAEVVGFLALGDGVIDQLYVDPEQQGRGVGTALLDKAKELSPEGLKLFTHQRNESARRFYERRGLSVVKLGISPPPESEPDVEYCWEPPGTEHHPA